MSPIRTSSRNLSQLVELILSGPQHNSGPHFRFAVPTGDSICLDTFKFLSFFVRENDWDTFVRYDEFLARRTLEPMYLSTSSICGSVRAANRENASGRSSTRRRIPSGIF